jgi:hypothetical protein
MRSLVYVAITFMVMGLAFWAYQQNYQTQAVLKQTRSLQNDIAALRERLSVLRAEWAYLNRPSRLRDLADLNFDRLQLLPLSPDQFGRIGQVSYPIPQIEGFENVVDVRGTLAEDDQ